VWAFTGSGERWPRRSAPVGAKLFISPRTVESHVSSLWARARREGRTELVERTARWPRTRHRSRQMWRGCCRLTTAGRGGAGSAPASVPVRNSARTAARSSAVSMALDGCACRSGRIRACRRRWRGKASIGNGRPRWGCRDARSSARRGGCPADQRRDRRQAVYFGADGRVTRAVAVAPACREDRSELVDRVRALAADTSMLGGVDGEVSLPTGTVPFLLTDIRRAAVTATGHERCGRLPAPVHVTP